MLYQDTQSSVANSTSSRNLEGYEQFPRRAARGRCAAGGGESLPHRRALSRRGVPIPPKSAEFMQLFRTVQKDIHKLQGCHWGRLQEMANKIDFFLTPMLGRLEDEREKPIVLP